MRTNNTNNKNSERSSDSKDSRRNSSSEKKPRSAGGFKKPTDSSKRYDAKSSDRPRFKTDSRRTDKGFDPSEKAPRFSKDRAPLSRDGRDADRAPQSRDYKAKPKFFKSKDGQDANRAPQSRDYKAKPRFSDARDNKVKDRAPQSGVNDYRPRAKSFDTPRKESSSRETGRSKVGDSQVSFPKPMKRDANYDPNAKYSLKKQIEFKKQNLMASDTIRLNRFLSNAGICSRREADEYIKAGVVTVNGQIITELGVKVSFTDKVMFHDQTVKSEKKVYILLNKPKDCVTTSDDPQERITVMDLIRGACTERVYPVGRLDRNTTGVLLLTNDGDLAARLTHPKYNKKKIYHVFLDKPLTKADLEAITNGVKLEDGEIKADRVEYVEENDKKQVGIEIHSGKNRVVRRIFESLGYKVEKLDRVFFAGLTKKNISRGKYRFLSEKEVNMLNMGAVE